jgi:hypothetical protein
MMGKSNTRALLALSLSSTEPPVSIKHFTGGRESDRVRRAIEKDNSNLPLDDFEAYMRTMLPAWIALELRMMFQIYQEGWFIPTSAEVATLSALLHRAPRSYEDFVRETAKEWKAKSP